ncbi:TRAP transporter large permease [Peteryoungia desertarenae]|uniref:TRAP transporter large permease protein n=1 Tax=Peteryoungia desertarenae TaxID=1813451 RepID=A0ABX6QPQ5_9HYPH|nr:TRAP transporter large permease [Peteryoungia desertarenae]QLF70469.1 TRAP transporter large permease [Peteryoungia desertarenae]
MGLLLSVFFGLLLLSVPVFVALGGASLAYTHFIGNLPDFVVLHRMAGGVDSFPLIAVPFFILAGNLMNSAGITNRIFDFATAAVGWLKGGLGHVNVTASVIFAGMSGAAVADAGGLGTIEVKAMRDRGYNDHLAVGVTAASSTIGPIIPPSLPMVIFGVMANVSIGQLFAAGFIPGMMMALSLMGYISWYAWRYKIGADQPFILGVLGRTFIQAIPALLTPIIIIGGIATGAFTPTEAAIAACAWALFLGFVVYRTLSIKRFYQISINTIETTASVLMIVAAASLFGWVLTVTQVTAQFTALLLTITDDPIMLLLIINVIILIVGCFMETIAAISILVPILMPAVAAVGIDPVQFGVVMVLNLMIGLITPPIGMVLFVLSRVANISIEKTIKATAPFLIPLLGVLLLITIFPQLTLYLPELWYR